MAMWMFSSIVAVPGSFMLVRKAGSDISLIQVHLSGAGRKLISPWFEGGLY
jgi:hypothetical protein